METIDPENLDIEAKAEIGEAELAGLPRDSRLNTPDSPPAVEPLTKRRSRLRGKPAGFGL
jgi:hypothetical protein